MDGMELEGRPRRPLMLKEWMELESSAELSRDGFGCYPRHLAAEFRSVSGRRRNMDVIARFSAAVRAALSRPPPGREREAAAALSRSISRRLRVGFWKKRSGDAEETGRPVASCSFATAASSRRRDAPSSPAMSPRRLSWEGRQVGGDGARLGAGRRSHETVVKVCECETTCQLDEEREQRLSPVSVMDFLSQDEDEGNDDDESNDHGGGGDGRSEDDGGSPTFEQSLANIRRASQQLLQRIRRFEQLAEVDTSDVDDATTATEDASYHVEELDSNSAGGDDEDDAEGAHDLLGLPEAALPSPCDNASQCFRGLLRDFFREGLLASCHDGRSDDLDVERLLLETARAWLDGRHGALRSDGKAEVEEIERLGRWRCFREDEQELLGCDVEGGIFWSLMEELVDDLC